MFNSKIVNKIVVICSLFIFFIYCNDDKLTEPENESSFVGNWKVSSMSWDGPNESGSYDISQLDSLGVIWKLNIESDKSVEQITNLSGPITTQPGSWSTDGNKLTLSLKSPVSEEMGTMIYQYYVENNILKLEWTIASGSIYYSAEFTKY